MASSRLSDLDFSICSNSPSLICLTASESNLKNPEIIVIK